MNRQLNKLKFINTRVITWAKASALITASVVLSTMSVASAHGSGSSWKHHSKAFGNVDYNAGFDRSAKFEVFEKKHHNYCGQWTVNGTYTIDFEYLSVHYVHDAVIANQAASGNYDISGGYPAGGPQTYAWNGTGNVSGASVTNSVDYTLGAPSTHMDMTGTIAPDGTMSGNWSDNYGGGSRSGTWTTASGAAVQNTECKGDGNFRYSDVNGDWYKVKDVKYVNIEGDDAWFAGQVTKASQTSWVGNWVFVKVHDGGPPANVGDVISGSFTDENTAKLGVANMANPADGPFVVTHGNIKVQ